MPYDLPNPINNADIFKEKSAELEKEALVDIGLWGTMKKRGGTSDLKPMIEAGAMSFKMSTFETDEYRFPEIPNEDRKSTRLNSSHVSISYAVFCLKKK